MTNPESVDLNFVTSDVSGGTWLQWADPFTDITDLVNQAIAKVQGPPRKCISRLVIAGHGSTADGFFVFDPDTAGTEFVDGMVGRNPFGSPSVQAQLARLRPYFCTDAIIEFRVCGLGKGRKGEVAVQALADAAGVPVTAPTASISSLAAIGGLAADWRTAYPADWRQPQVVSFWRGDPARRPTIGSPQDIAPITGRTVTGQYVPLPGVNPVTLTPPATMPVAPGSGVGRKIAAGAAAGLFVVAVGAGVALHRGGGTSTAALVAGAAVTAVAGQPAAAAGPSIEVRISPIEAVFTQATFTTVYTVLVTVTAPPGAASNLAFAWSGADCGTFEPDRFDARIFRWVHPHPPCDATTDHADRTITLLASWGDRQLRCTYRGAASGVGPLCVDVRTGVAPTPGGN